jgi:hypothetical protein
LVKQRLQPVDVTALDCAGEGDGDRIVVSEKHGPI